MFAAREYDRGRSVPRTPSRRGSPGPVASRHGSPGLLQRQLGNRLVREAVSPSAPRLQRACACGGSCADCRGEEEEGPRVQAKLVVGAPGDRFEREADRVAERVTTGGAASAHPARPAVQRLSDGSGGGGGPPTGALPSGQVRALSPGTRAFMEPRFGVDFGEVRLHTGSAAEAAADRLRARAFTYGRDIWLGRGAHEGDQRLMAHELTHVVQQSGGAPRRISRQTIDATCADREEVLRTAWEHGARLTNETVETLETVVELGRQPGGADRYHPRAAMALRNMFGEVYGLEGLGEGEFGLTNVPRIIEKYRRIAEGFSEGKNLRCDPGTVNQGNECDWRSAFVVSGNRDDIFLCPAFFAETGEEGDVSRGATLLHEMAHLKLNAAHAGLPERTFPPAMFDCSESLGLSFDDALRNAFAYDILANCLHGNRPSNVIEAGPVGEEEPGAAAAADRRFTLTGAVGGRLLDDTRRFASLIGSQVSLRTGEVVVWNPVIGLNVLYVPGMAEDRAHLAAAVLDVGLRIQQPVEGLYFDILGSGFVGFEAETGAETRFTGGVGAGLGAGWRWDRIELGASARGLLPLEEAPALDRGTLLILGQGAVRF